MTTRDNFRMCMTERRKHNRASAEYAYLTRAARKLVWIMRGVPAIKWSE